MPPSRAFSLEYGSVDDYDGGSAYKIEMSLADHDSNKDEEVPEIIKHIVEEEQEIETHKKP